MTPDRNVLRRLRRRYLALLALCVLLPTQGCGLLLDEFTMLDRAPPRPAPAELPEGP